MSQSSASSDVPAHAENRQRYTALMANELELKWQDRWEQTQAFRAPNPGETGFDGSRPKFYCLDMFPYPSGAGLHVGHPEGYTATDILCRYRRMQGDNVLHPMGWDAFGLPAEQYAVQTGVHPAVTTNRAIENFRRQLKRFGFSYDWSREISTTDPSYYRWTQWIWLQAYHAWYDDALDRARPIKELLRELQDGTAFVGPSGELIRPGTAGKTQALGGDPVGVRKWHELSPQEQRDFIDTRRLAYLGEQTVNWCPKLGTVLANEEVIDGRSERGGFPVFRLPLRQWMFRITAYAERLLRDLDLIRWPESTRLMQTEWIGRSEGADIDFDVEGRSNVPFIRVFTTRPDTIFGATFLVIAPEHPLVDDLVAAPAPDTDSTRLAAYVNEARNRPDIDRISESREKSGVFTGVYAINPATLERIPIWVADYVLMSYGHGAIMAVPAHDQRDFEFAQTFGLPIRDVVYPASLAALHLFADRASERVLESAALAVIASEFVARSMQGEGDADQLYAELVRDIDLDQPGATRKEADAWREAIETRCGLDLREVVHAMKRRGLALACSRADAEAGVSVNSARAGAEGISINGLASDDAKRAVVEWLEAQSIGRRRVNYRLRDWLFSRQRYWGEPFPIVFDEAGNHYPVSESHLPVRLPELADYTPIESDTPVPPLSKATDWVNTTAGEAGVDPDVLPPDRRVRRETNTMPGWAGSCWYYLRFCDPHNEESFVGREAERYWMVSASSSGQPHAGGVDLYVGGAEHAVLHLLYARFWHKMLYDLGYVSTPEPAGRLFHQGLILSFAYQRADRSLVPVDMVTQNEDGTFVERETGAPLTQVVAKMSKSLKNVINPDDVIAEYGADTFRLYEMYLGPLDASKPWNPRDIAGPFRFLQRFWRMCINEHTGLVNIADSPNPDVERKLHEVTQRVGHDIERLAFNTAIAALIELVNLASASTAHLTRDQMNRAVRLLAPFAPHMAEEIWERMGEEGFVSHAAWPTYDESMLRADTIEIPVQVNGRLRSRISVAADATEEQVRATALADDRVAEHVASGAVRKVIVVPGRMVNVIVG